MRTVVKIRVDMGKVRQDNAAFKRKLRSYIKGKDLERLHKLYEKNWVKLVKEIEAHDMGEGRDDTYRYRDRLMTRAENKIKGYTGKEYEDSDGDCTYKGHKELTILDFICKKTLTTHANYGIMHSIDDND